MGPLVPDIITDQLNLLVALVLGVLFGLILEQAGFSSSRKLTGLFYGTDFTVLRVFFTAGVTAMMGVTLLGAVGVLDLDVIYVNPTFVTSALVGGAIMGVGFVVGGYCPGTSFCGAAVGRIDAMIFVAGGLVGAFVFGEAFPYVQPLYMAHGLGDVTLPAALGVSPGAVLIAWTVIAVATFVVIGRIEPRVAADAPVRHFPTGRHRVAGAAFLVVAVAVARLGTWQDRLVTQVMAPAYRAVHVPRAIDSDEVAFRLLDKDPRLQLIDVRPQAQFTAFSLPTAVNITPLALFGKLWRDPLSRAHDLKVFFADDERDAITAALLAERLGFKNVVVLAGGLQALQADLLTMVPPALAAEPPAGGSGDAETAAFRAEAGPKLAALIKERGKTPVAAPVVKKVSGGCGV